MTDDQAIAITVDAGARASEMPTCGDATRSEGPADIADALSRTSRDLRALQVGVDLSEIRMDLRSLNGILNSLRNIERSLRNLERSMRHLEWMTAGLLALTLAMAVKVFSEP
jgi:hypothetical protein